jgi:hypothetical protein
VFYHLQLSARSTRSVRECARCVNLATSAFPQT